MIHLCSEDGVVLKTQESQTMSEDMLSGGEAAGGDSDIRSRYLQSFDRRGIDGFQGPRLGIALVVLRRRWLILLPHAQHPRATGRTDTPLVQGGVHSFALAPIMG